MFDLAPNIDLIFTEAGDPADRIRAADSAEIARAVGSPDVGILYDLYHSVAEGEDVSRAISDNADVIRYFQLADSSGRGEPGSGTIDWSERLAQLAAAGYDGPLGLEFYPTQDSVAAVRRIQDLAAAS